MKKIPKYEQNTQLEFHTPQDEHSYYDENVERASREHSNHRREKQMIKRQRNKAKILSKVLLFIAILVVISTLILAFYFFKTIFLDQQNPEEEIGQGQIKEPNGNIPAPKVSSYHMVGYNHRHNLGPFKYPTVGIPFPGNAYNSTRVSDSKLAQFDEKVNELFKPYVNTDCSFERFGDGWRPDGGYVICKNFLKQTEALINIGIDGYDNFGCQISSLNKMPNYQYDCVNPSEPKCYTNNEGNKFHHICVGSKTQITPKKSFYTLEDMLKFHQLEDKHIFLSIDCQGGEYPGFKYFPVEKLDNIDQIVAEFHFDEIYPEEWGVLDIIETLTDKFVSVNYHMNNYGCMTGKKNRKLKSRAVEVTLVNKKLITVFSDARSFQVNGLNKPNGSQRDCQI